MLSNHLIGSYKFVLFVDNVGLEKNAKFLLKKILEEQNLNFEFYNGSEEIVEKKYLIIESISNLELTHCLQNLFNLVQRLKSNDNVIQLLGWISSKNVQSRILIPFLEHMSNIIVTINSNNHLTIMSKSKSGVVKFKEYHHELLTGKTSIKEYKKESIKQISASDANEDIENLGTFKIGQKADELEAKKNLKLPFEKIELASHERSFEKESKIIYTPDSVDDFDEEDDPDNDLQF